MNPVETAIATTRDERFSIRAKREEKALVEQAAAASHMTTSQFVMHAALRSAEEVLTDQTRFTLPADQWDSFVAALDRPARVIPELERAASKPSPFNER
jgi:uncharacterized protein (DUF1778 family)